MLKLIVRRLVLAIPLLLVVSFLVFCLIDLAPGDPAIAFAGENATPEQVELVREQLRLDDPVIERYGRWLGSAVHGDLGNSLRLQASVRSLLVHKSRVTLSLVLVSMVYALGGAVTLGVLSALRPRGLLDRSITFGASLGLSLPSFWIGLTLVLMFSVRRGWFPAIGYASPGDEGWWEWLRHMILPAIALGTSMMAELTLHVRSALAEVLERDFVLAAHARGLGRARVLLQHGLKNAAAPVVTVFGFRLAQLLGGAAVVESVFVLPGLGTLAVDATLSKDITLLLGLVVFISVVVVVINVVVDISYGYFNPRVRE